MKTPVLTAITQFARAALGTSMTATQQQARHILLGLIGAPIKHSASPAMHEAAAEALGWKGFYQLIEVRGADTAALRRILDGVRYLGFAGVNVTFPYKEAVIPLLDDLSESAQGVGAVNTIAVQSGRLIGHNTDVTGFGRAVEDLLAASEGPIAVIGAGGIGKAAAVAMAQKRAKAIHVFDLDLRKAEALARTLAPMTGVTVARSVDEAVAGVSGLVNGTPIGMLPSRESPVDSSLLHPGLWVADAVYHPLWTPLLLAARKAGAKVLSGRALAIYQAADAFEIFTGVRPSGDVMAAAFDRVIQGRENGPSGQGVPAAALGA
jgi:shikimate dehydrogenase